MFKDYENPYNIKLLLDQKNIELENYEIDFPECIDRIISLREDIDELEEALNFAIQDYESEYYNSDY